MDVFGSGLKIGGLVVEWSMVNNEKRKDRAEVLPLRRYYISLIVHQFSSLDKINWFNDGVELQPLGI